MNQAEIMFQKVKRVAKDNATCQRILLQLMDEREDIIDQITEINKRQWDAITPEGIVRMYEEDAKGDLNKFIAIYDKAMKDAGWIRRNFYNGYEKGISEDCYY